jgi:8-hydroxy-5-deazaflavin:NADPH oxidoreductase
MDIAIIGTGSVGSALARRWHAAGHAVTLGARDPAAGGVAGLAAELGASAGTPAEATGRAEVVVLAVPGGAVAATAASLAAELAGKVVVVPANDMSGAVPDVAGAVAAAAPDARVVRAFNTIPVEAMAAGGVDGFYACDDDADEAARTLVADCGLWPVRVGGLDSAALLDGLFRVWAALVFRQGHGRRVAFHLQEF